jgi:predicted metalloprotease
MGFPIGAGKLGIGGTVVLLILSLVFGQDFLGTGGGGGGGDVAPTGQQAPVQSTPEEEKEVQFVSFVLDDVQDTWSKVFERAGRTYQPARLVLFRDATQTACGFGQAASGPFYCPSDQKVYIDLGFYEELQRRFGSPGDFAQAYVLAHEIGHHVQHLLGTDADVQRLSRDDPRAQNPLSVRLELQADCYAGVWANSTAQRDILQEGDVEEGINAAAAVGDDRLQRMSGRGVNPDAFTHGTSQQRASWFQRGYQSGAIENCDTFRGS